MPFHRVGSGFYVRLPACFATGQVRQHHGVDSAPV